MSPQNRGIRLNPEEPIDEDEDVQAERIRTATASTTSRLEEVPKHITNWMFMVVSKNCKE